MTNATLQRELVQDTAVPTEAFLRHQLDLLRDLIDAMPEDATERQGLIKVRESMRNHLSALLLRSDETFLKSMYEGLRRLQNGEPPAGIVTDDELNALLGL